MRLSARIIGIVLAAATLAASSRSLFDGRGWRVGNHDENARQKLTEYVLPKESVDSWHELVTHQTFVDPGHAVPLKRLMAQTQRGLANGCPSLDFKVVQESEKEIVYEWQDGGCGGFPAQHEVDRLAVCPSGECRWAYATTVLPFEPKARKQWLAVLAKLPADSEP